MAPVAQSPNLALGGAFCQFSRGWTPGRLSARPYSGRIHIGPEITTSGGAPPHIRLLQVRRMNIFRQALFGLGCLQPFPRFSISPSVSLLDGKPSLSPACVIQFAPFTLKEGNLGGLSPPMDLGDKHRSQSKTIGSLRAEWCQSHRIHASHHAACFSKRFYGFTGRPHFFNGRPDRGSNQCFTWRPVLD